MRNRIVQAPLAARIDGVPVLLRNLQRSVPIDTKRLCRMAEKILAAARVENTELSIILVSDRRMRALNERYRKKNRPTDVLSFPLAMDGAGQPRYSSRIRPQAQPPKLLGDVVISLSTAQRQATALGHDLHEEVARLLVHGVLHLLGYDHDQGPREAARMIRQEHRLLRIVAAT